MKLKAVGFFPLFLSFPPPLNTCLVYIAKDLKKMFKFIFPSVIRAKVVLRAQAAEWSGMGEALVWAVELTATGKAENNTRVSFSVSTEYTYLLYFLNQRDLQFWARILFNYLLKPISRD